MNANKLILIGPFHQVLTMKDLPIKGPIKDDQLEVIPNGGILMKDGKISACGDYESLKSDADEFIKIEGHHVALPGIVDAHTHICFGGNRARDFALRNAGSSYLEIAAAGGGIWDSVTQTRLLSKQVLKEGIIIRARKLMASGTTTIEVKSGYGLSVAEELKMLEAINEANSELPCQLIPTCLAAHIIPKEYKNNPDSYVSEIVNNLFPILKERNLTNRVDAFLEKEAYDSDLITPYFDAAKKLGFDITVHADQFSPGGSELAVRYGAVSADHLEVSTQKEIDIIANSNTVPVALPGATIGLGVTFTPARKLLDAGCSLAIASDYNPGSAPMGDLITQASILATFQKLSNAEVLAGVTTRAADALRIDNKGKLQSGFDADIAIFPTDNYQNITYYQGQLKPCMTIAKGQVVYKK